jgi:hypothetical protein
LNFEIQVYYILRQRSTKIAPQQEPQEAETMSKGPYSIIHDKKKDTMVTLNTFSSIKNIKIEKSNA